MFHYCFILSQDFDGSFAGPQMCSIILINTLIIHIYCVRIKLGEYGGQTKKLHC